MTTETTTMFENVTLTYNKKFLSFQFFDSVIFLSFYMLCKLCECNTNAMFYNIDVFVYMKIKRFLSLSAFDSSPLFILIPFYNFTMLCYITITISNNFNIELN